MAKKITDSNTTKNVVSGGLISATAVAGVIAAVRTNFPDLPMWPEGMDLIIGGGIAALLTAVISRFIAFRRNPKKKTNVTTRLLPFLIGAALMNGCATNGIKVSEVTPDGGSLIVKQRTMSTWGSRTDEGTGSFVYSGTSEDGSSFDMRAGAAVLGQQAGDPSELIQAVAQILNAISGQYLDARVREGEIKAEVATEAMERLGPLKLKGEYP